MRKAQQQYEESEIEVLEPLEGTALESITKGEIDIAIATAHKFPRSISKFKKDAMSMACLDEETASSCFYALKRENKLIEGPSVRLAEIVGSAWGNLRYGARVVSVEDKFVTAQGACHDLEKNNSATIEVRRRITTREGKRFGDDMIGVTANAACSIALRNAIFKVVPFAYAKDVYEQAKKTAIGGAKTLEKKRSEMIQYFSKMGVSEPQIVAAVGKTNAEDIGLEELATLKGFATAIKDGDTTIEQCFKSNHEGVNVSLEDLKKDFHNRLGHAGSKHTVEQMESYMRGVAGNMQLQEQDLYLRMLNEWEKEGPRFQESFMVKMQSSLSKTSPANTSPAPNGKPEQKKAETTVETGKKEEPPKGQAEILARMRKEILKAVSHFGSKDEINAALTAAADGQMDIGLLEKIDDQAMLHDILEKLKVKK